MPDELKPWHKTQMIDIEYDRVDLVGEGANSQAFIKLFKSKKGGNTMDLEQILKAMKPEHAEVVRKALEAKEQEGIEKGKKDNEVPAAGSTEEDILKSVKDPAVKALLETQIAKTKAAESVAKALREEQDGKEAISKAKEVPNIGAEEAKLAEVYKKLKSVDSTLCDDVFGIFKAASALVNEGGAFTEVGKGSEGYTGADEATVWAKIEAVADGISKSKNISKSSAISEAIQSNPTLYSEYLKAQEA